MGSINVIVTIANMRAPGMTLIGLLFVWTWLITAYLLIAVMLFLAGVVTMMLMDIRTSVQRFLMLAVVVILYAVPALCILFFGHPEVYIMILPAFGVVSAIIPVRTEKVVRL